MTEIINRIIDDCAKKWGMSVEDVKGKRLFARFIKARHEAAFRIRQATTLSYPEIGHFLGGMCHTSVMYACRMFVSQPEKYQMLRSVVDELIKEKAEREEKAADRKINAARRRKGAAVKKPVVKKRKVKKQ